MERIVSQSKEVEERSIFSGFQNFDIDWTEGVNPKDIQISANLQLGEDNLLVSGEKETVSLVVKNTGTEPLYQLSATTTSEASSLDHREFNIGKLMPGQDKMVEKDIFLPYGFDDEFAELQIVFRDPKNRNLQEIQLPYQTKGHNRPLFSYNIELFFQILIKKLLILLLKVLVEDYIGENTKQMLVEVVIM